MALTKIFIVSSILVLMISSPAAAQTVTDPSLSLSPAPAPAPAYVDLKHLLSVAGPFGTFLKYLEQTKVIDTFQNQANNTEQGITLFVPTDSAFASLKKPSLSNLTEDQLKSLLLFHAFPNYYSLAEFQNLSKSNPVSTFAGGQYTLNMTYTSGLVHASSGWSNPKISSSVYSTPPAAVYEVMQVLLPEAIFGTAPAPAPVPAPAPAPDTTKPSDLAPSAKVESPKASVSNKSSSYKISFDVSNFIVLSVCSGLMLLL